MKKETVYGKSETDEQIIYHYCNVDKFEKIIKNKCFYMTDVHKMNDSSEEKLFLEVAEIVLEKLLNEFKGKSKNTDQDLENYIYKFKKNFHNISFACCFSARGDDLSQWRGYTDNGTGICIGIDKKVFENCNNSRVCFKKMSYMNLNSIEANSDFQDLKTRIISIFPKSCELKPAEFATFTHMLVEVTMPFRSFIKDDSFINENEYRLCYYDKLHDVAHINNFDEDLQRNMNETVDENRFAISEVDHYCKDGNLIAFRKLIFGDNIKNVIRKIYIGPKCKLTEIDIKNLLVNQGIILKFSDIRKSSSTFI